MLHIMTQHIFKLVQEWDKTNALNNNYKIDGLIKNLQLKKIIHYTLSQLIIAHLLF